MTETVRYRHRPRRPTMDLDEHTSRAIWHLRPPELDVDAEMRREAAHRVATAADAEGIPDKARIAALCFAFWLTTAPEATEAGPRAVGPRRAAAYQVCAPRRPPSALRPVSGPGPRGCPSGPGMRRRRLRAGSPRRCPMSPEELRIPDHSIPGQRAAVQTVAAALHHRNEGDA